MLEKLFKFDFNGIIDLGVTKTVTGFYLSQLNLDPDPTCRKNPDPQPWKRMYPARQDAFRWHLHAFIYSGFQDRIDRIYISVYLYQMITTKQKGQSLYFDMFKALEQIESGHKSDFFSSEKTYFLPCLRKMSYHLI